MTLLEVSKSQDIPKHSGKNFAAVHTGKSEELHQYKLDHPAVPRKVAGKLFLKDHIGLTSSQISLNKLPPGVALPFSHAHKHNEEIYIFTGGEGEMQVDGETFKVTEGSVVRVAPAGMRTWRNTGNGDLYYVVIQAKEGSLDQDTFEDGVLGESAPVWP